MAECFGIWVQRCLNAVLESAQFLEKKGIDQLSRSIIN